MSRHTQSAKKSVAFIGNCQMGIYRYLSEIPYFRQTFHVRVVYVFKVAEEDMKSFLTDAHGFDYIVTQMISNNFRGNPIFSTETLLANVESSPTCRVVVIPSCHFSFCFPFTISRDFEYVEQWIDFFVKDTPRGESEQTLVDKLAGRADDKRSAWEKFHEVLNDPELFSAREIENRFECCIGELRKREHLTKDFCDSNNVCLFVPISDYIEAHRHCVLFHTFNHPSGEILRHLARNVYRFIAESEWDCAPRMRMFFSDTQFNLLCQYELLDKYKSPIPLCLQRWYGENADLKTYNENLCFRGVSCDAKGFFDMYVARRALEENRSADHERQRMLKQTRKPFLLANKNVYSGMDSGIIKCNIQRKTAASPQSNKLVRCASTSSMNFSDSMSQSAVATTGEANFDTPPVAPRIKYAAKRQPQSNKAAAKSVADDMLHSKTTKIFKAAHKPRCHRAVTCAEKETEPTPLADTHVEQQSESEPQGRDENNNNNNNNNNNAKCMIVCRKAGACASGRRKAVPKFVAASTAVH